jgi:AcrR family transcriptional regulator
MSRQKRPITNLKDACLVEALAIIEADGVEKLSLREVARRLGVSHQAPYKHFQSRDHILAGVVARVFAGFAAYLDSAPRSPDPDHDMAEMGRSYLAYAAQHPLQYRLMFGTPLPDGAAHPEMMAQAQHAFALLRAALRRRAAARGVVLDPRQETLDALFIWSGLHGLASIQSSSVSKTLAIEPDVMAQSGLHLLLRFGAALGGDAR